MWIGLTAELFVTYQMHVLYTCVSLHLLDVWPVVVSAVRHRGEPLEIHWESSRWDHDEVKSYHPQVWRNSSGKMRRGLAVHCFDEFVLKLWIVCIRLSISAV